MEKTEADSGEEKLGFPGQGVQPCHAFGTKLVPVIGIGGKFPAANAVVPVSADEVTAVFTDPVAGLCTLGALADGVPEEPDVIRRDFPNDAFHGTCGNHVSVQIGEKENAHLDPPCAGTAYGPAAKAHAGGRGQRG